MWDDAGRPASRPSWRCSASRIPGRDPLTLAACLDKSIAKQFIEHEGSINAPFGRLLSPDDPATSERLIDELFQGRNGCLTTLILKPALEGSSKGIRGKCLADHKDEAVAIYRRLARDYHQPIVAEEYIEGDEITVGLIGNHGPQGEMPRILGVMRIVPHEQKSRFVYSLEFKREGWLRATPEVPAVLPESTLAVIRFAAYSRFLCPWLPRSGPNRLSSPRRRPFLSRGQPNARPDPWVEATCPFWLMGTGAATLT